MRKFRSFNAYNLLEHIYKAPLEQVICNTKPVIRQVANSSAGYGLELQIVKFSTDQEILSGYL